MYATHLQVEAQIKQSSCEAQLRLMGLGDSLETDKSTVDHLGTHQYIVSDSRDAGISLFRPLSEPRSFLLWCQV